GARARGPGVPAVGQLRAEEGRGDRSHPPLRAARAAPLAAVGAPRLPRVRALLQGQPVSRVPRQGTRRLGSPRERRGGVARRRHGGAANRNCLSVLSGTYVHRGSLSSQLASAERAEWCSMNGTSSAISCISPKLLELVKSSP